LSKEKHADEALRWLGQALLSRTDQYPQDFDNLVAADAVLRPKVGVNEVRQIPLVELMFRERFVPEASHVVAYPCGLDLSNKAVHLDG
jgi:hypothetical protein